ncbi:MAG: hypothetical protein A2V88_08350 [Elusimicrobia bacterium RBG_16_66_12]|nr:MAG: hypothetical protein A2V88_08350 [Elusimicrobia bacterium RBG_16_66_12]
MRRDLELDTMLDGLAVDLGQLSIGEAIGADDEGEVVDLVTGGGGGQGPYGETPPGFVAPGAVPPRPEKWQLDAQPFAVLTITSGDTLVGLSATYLGDGGRWREIYDTGWNRSKFASPDRLDHTGPLQMPEEARANMKNWLAKGAPPGTLPGNPPPETLGEKAKRNWPLIAVLSLATAGGGYALYRASR